MIRERNYILTETEADPESARLALLEEIFDPATKRRLASLDIPEGSRCLEVGAGRGSIARWLSEAVGTDGHVVAADIDCRFLSGLPDNVEVRTLDVRTGELEPAAYDFLHCRALLMHLPEPIAVLDRMAAALRPGGLLLAEEGDYGLLAYNGHPDAQWATSLVHRNFAALASAKVMHAYLGRTLPGMLGEVGLELLGGEVDSSIARFDEPAFVFQRLSAEGSGPALVAAGIMTREEQARAREVRSSPSTVLTAASLVAAWGRRAG
jgi:2-polyprenyl-3-methyl-5-hydroxy-6-metoxy-1,4-benzoquinol methylase